MWDPKSKKSLVSCDVKFVEDVVDKDWMQQQQVQIGLRLQEIERSAVEEVQLHLDDLPGSELTSHHNGGGEQHVAGPVAKEGLEDESARVHSPSQPEPAAPAKVTKRSVQKRASPHGQQAATREKRVAAPPSRLKYCRLGGPKQGAMAGWYMKQMYITTTSLNGVLLEDIYMAQPDSYEDGTSWVCKLKKAIYGLMQAPRCWNKKLEDVLLGGGFKTSHADHNLFLLGEGELQLLLLVYVDDILLFSPSMEQIERTTKFLKDNSKCKMLGDVQEHLGLQIERDVERRWLKVHQSHYISGVMERYGVTGGPTVMTPFPASFKLKKAAEDDDGFEDEHQNEY
ncbi:unnamed protein product [Closterium sp. NIES-54]